LPTPLLSRGVGRIGEIKDAVMSDVNFRELRHAPAMPVNFAKAVMRPG